MNIAKYLDIGINIIKTMSNLKDLYLGILLCYLASSELND
jgi:hypothetical protein